MQTRTLASILHLAGLAAYNYLFWQQQMGINLLIFSTLLLTASLWRNPKSIRSPYVIITVSATLVTGSMTVWHHTGIAIFAHYLAFFTAQGFILQPVLRSVYYSILNTLANYLQLPASIIERVEEMSRTHKGVKRSLRITQLLLIPVAVYILFYLIYTNANPVFDKYSNMLWAGIGDWLVELLSNLSLTRLMFLLLGLLLIAGALYNRSVGFLLNEDLKRNETFLRIRSKIKNRRALAPQTMGLKYETRMGIILLIMVNLLLAIVNIIDINWLWFNRLQYGGDFSLKEYVHQGTELLIMSTLLSIGILLYLFRGNQNFYSKNKWLKQLAYLWIAQNAILCISVLLRSYYYIDFHGLAYKRIGVIVFLGLTIFGLITLFYKIHRTRSFYYLLYRNTWAVFAVFIGLSFINWDVLIARHNLSHDNPCGIDVDFYTRMSPAATVVVMENMDKVKEQIACHAKLPDSWVEYTSFSDFEADFQAHSRAFLDDYSNREWQSWNLADAEAFNSLKPKR